MAVATEAHIPRTISSRHRDELSRENRPSQPPSSACLEASGEDIGYISSASHRGTSHPDVTLWSQYLDTILPHPYLGTIVPCDIHQHFTSRQRDDRCGWTL
ncbi:hypothetical protein PV327_002639 [Microctonus hyperodae]|uniref:Uncharacterized protein n=1 Tax=Microctonus hyperodae TaxID=165561 RepID=A0AA39FG80_MICHY|nr:hypothetical protein PV327_002639 [Microctonus hyperodae]